MKFTRTLLITTAMLAALTTAAVAGEVKEIRIGYQKTGVLLVAKTRGSLEKYFAPKGITVKWAEFSLGPPLVEAINTGSLDYGHTGNTPPIFAQAAGANLVYAATGTSKASSSGIVLPKGSTIKTLTDLKGKRVGFSKASGSHDVIIAALEKVGLTYADITPVYLLPSDAAAAFERGTIDAWSIWDPYYAVAEHSDGARVLVDSDAVAPSYTFYLANGSFAKEHGAVLADLNKALAEVASWANDHKSEVEDVIVKATGIDAAVEHTVLQRSGFYVEPVGDDAIANQQASADRFARLKLIPEPIKVRDAVWTWKPAP